MEREKSIFKIIIEKIYNIFLFIILIPYNIVKYICLFIYRIINFIISIPSDNKKQREKNERQKEQEKEKLQAKEHIENNKNNELNFDKETDKKEILNKKDQKQEHRIAKEKIRMEKIRQKELLKKEKKSIFKQFKENNFITKNKQKKLDRKRQILTLDINSDDAKRSTEKIIFKYSAKNPNGKLEKGKFQGYSKLDVHSYLLSEGYEVYEINALAKASIFNTDLSLNRQMKKSSLVFYLTQLSTYLKSGIPIVDSIKILIEQAKKSEKIIWKSVLYELTMGATLSDAMYRCGNNVFPKLLINMIKTAEVTGDLSEVLDEQAEYYKSIEKSKKEMINAMMYPMFVLLFAVIIICFIMIAIIPEFVQIYDNIGASLPSITVLLINISNFLTNNLLTILLIIVCVVLVFTILYRKSISFKSNVQYILMHLPILRTVIINNEITMFSKTFASLLNNNIFITDSMDILSRITDNEIYKSIIYDAVISLSKGENISTSFKDHWAFPNVAYQMIVTGEKTGELGNMMKKVSEYYQEEYTNSISRIKTLIEPVLIVLLAVVVGDILLAVIIPMFSMYEGLV